MESLEKFGGIFFGYEINVLSYHKNIVYDATLSESQRVMLWQLILEEFGPNIHHISVVDNIVSYILGTFPYTPSNKYKSCTWKSQCHANKLFLIGREEKKEDCFLLIISIIQREKQKKLRNITTKIST